MVLKYIKPQENSLYYLLELISPNVRLEKMDKVLSLSCHLISRERLIAEHKKAMLHNPFHPCSKGYLDLLNEEHSTTIHELEKSLGRPISFQELELARKFCKPGSNESNGLGW